MGLNNVRNKCLRCPVLGVCTQDVLQCRSEFCPDFLLLLMIQSLAIEAKRCINKQNLTIPPHCNHVDEALWNFSLQSNRTS